MQIKKREERKERRRKEIKKEERGKEGVSSLHSRFSVGGTGQGPETSLQQTSVQDQCGSRCPHRGTVRGPQS